MSVQNLGTVFGPNILRPKIEDPVAIMEGEWHTFRFLPTLHKATQLHTVTHTPPSSLMQMLFYDCTSTDQLFKNNGL